MPYPPHIWTFEVKHAQLLYGLSAPPPAGSGLCAAGTRAGGSPAATKRMPALRTMLFLRL